MHTLALCPSVQQQTSAPASVPRFSFGGSACWACFQASERPTSWHLGTGEAGEAEHHDECLECTRQNCYSDSGTSGHAKAKTPGTGIPRVGAELMSGCVHINLWRRVGLLEPCYGLRGFASGGKSREEARNATLASGSAYAT